MTSKKINQSLSQSKPTLEILGEALYVAIFFSYVALEYSWPKSFTYEGQSFALRTLVFTLGTLAGLLIVGLLRKKATNVNLFTIGLIGTFVSFFLTIWDKLFFSSFISITHTLVACAASSILTLAWCERISLKSSRERSLLLAMDSFFIVLLTTVALTTNENLAIPFIELLVIASTIGELRIIKRRTANAKIVNNENTSLPRYLLLVLFLFGLAQSSLCLLSRKAIGGETSLPLEILPIFLPLWILFISITITIALFLFFSKKVSSVLFSVLTPLLSIGLLLPPYFLLGSQEMLRAVIIFIIICEISICSIGPSNAKWTIGKGPFTFVFWQRSLGLVGAMVGYTITSFLIEDINIQNYGGAAAALIYVAICLTVVTLFERTKLATNNTTNSDKKSFKNACSTLSLRYGLTAREAEVFTLVARGRTLPYVQKKLCIAPGTAATHINHIYKKMNISNRQELISMIEHERKEA